MKELPQRIDPVTLREPPAAADAARSPVAQVQNAALASGATVAALLVIALGLWLAERKQEPTPVLWVGIIVLTGRWLPTLLFQLAALRAWGASPAVRFVNALADVLEPAVQRHGIESVVREVRRAIRKLDEEADHAEHR